MFRPRLALAVLAIALYLSASVRIGNVYPFATFDMFAGQWAEAHQVLATTLSEGRTAALGAWSSWNCDDVSRRPPASVGGVELPWCAMDEGHPEYEPKALAHIAAGQLSEAQPGAIGVAIVRRTWRKPTADAPATRSDCVLRLCTALPATGAP